MVSADCMQLLEWRLPLQTGVQVSCMLCRDRLDAVRNYGMFTSASALGQVTNEITRATLVYGEMSFSVFKKMTLMPSYVALAAQVASSLHSALHANIFETSSAE